METCIVWEQCPRENQMSRSERTSDCVILERLEIPFRVILALTVLWFVFLSLAAGNHAFQGRLKANHVQTAFVLYCFAAGILLLNVPFRAAAMGELLFSEKQTARFPRYCLAEMLIPLLTIPVIAMQIVEPPRSSWNCWLPYIQLAVYYVAFTLLATVAVGLNFSATFAVAMTYAGILVPTILPFWLAPMLQYCQQAENWISRLLYLNPVLMVAKSLEVDVLRLPIFYQSTPLAQVYVRYPNSWRVLILWGCVVACEFLALVGIVWHRKVKTEHAK